MEAMDACFLLSKSEDFVGKLSKLCQTSMVLDYQREFQRLSNRVKGLSEEYLINLYLSGLKDDIRIEVQKFKPTILPKAFSLARLHEEEVNVWLGVGRLEVGQPQLMPNSNEAKFSTSIIKRLTPTKARERREKGLCYHCDERYTPDHKCKTQTLFWIEGLLEEDNEEVLSSNLLEGPTLRTRFAKGVGVDAC